MVVFLQTRPSKWQPQHRRADAAAATCAISQISGPGLGDLASRCSLASGGGPAYYEVWCENLVKPAYYFVAKFQSFISEKEICPNKQEKKIGNNNFRI